MLFFYQGTHAQDLNFNVTGDGTCSSQNNKTFPCGANGDVDSELTGGAGVVKVVYQPSDGLQYYVSAAAGNYSLQVASLTVVNTLQGDRPGMQYTFGVKAVVVPGVTLGAGRHHMDLEKGSKSSSGSSLITPSIALDGSVSYQRHHFNRMHPVVTAGTDNIDQSLDILRYQLALEASQRIAFSDTTMIFEPYGGVKWLRSHAWLKDQTTGARMGGIEDVISPFVGLNLPIYENEGLFAEASFVDGIQYAAGLSVRFGGKK